MKKKLVIVLSLGVLAAVALVGCGSKKAKDSDKDTTEVTTKINAETTKETKETKEETTTTESAKQDETTLSSNETTTSAETQASLEANGYTDEELVKMASDYYERHNNYRPGISAIDSIKEDGTVVIHLYDDMDDHTATCAWYEVNRKTATGKDTIANTDVDLTK